MLQQGARWVKSAGRRTVRTAAMATAGLRVPPEIVIIGVKRGGTTSLFRDLERHQSMCPLVPSARRLPLRENMKGVHYFDSDMTKSSIWFRSHFPTTATRRLRQRSTGAAFSAEASPYYFFHPLAARRAVLALPETTKFVVMLRDPVERTVSQWAEQTRNGIETLGLEEALDAESSRVGDAEQQLLSGSLLHSDAHEFQSYARQSLYVASLQRWYGAAGRDRVLVLFSEDYYRDPVTTLKQVTDSIDVPPMVDRAGEHRNSAARPGTLDAQLDRRLTDFFRADVAAVGALLGVVPPWPRFSSSRLDEPMTS